MYKIMVLALLLMSQSVMSDQVKIVDVKMQKKHPEQYRIDVTLLHADSGWDHYADGWEVLDTNKKIIAKRVLGHPHVNEQPFTRSLYSVTIPSREKLIYIRAHDKVHGYGDLYKINLNK